MTQLVWFRTDLRSHDNPALSAACHQSEDAVLGVAFVTTEQWQQHGLGPRKIQLIKNSMLALKQELGQLNIPLLLLQADSFAASVEHLKEIIEQLNIDRVFFNIEYEINERRRDIEFKHWCRTQQVAVNQFHDQTLLPPGEVLTKQRQPFKVFTPFKRAWMQHAEGRISVPLPQPKKRVAAMQKPLIDFMQAQESAVAFVPDPLWSVNEDEAHQRLNDFADERAAQYQQLRDIPNADATSRLSLYLSLGLISPLQCLHVALIHNSGQLVSGLPGFDTWINELIWRDFYRHLLVAFPHLCMHKAFKPETEQVQWRNHEADFQAWCEGRTGYPLVDAAQRQLLHEGWMHNRLRMVSAMFLTKHLLIDWRKGEAFFNYHLVDADLASNNGGWQWSASTGADGVPYFRIFNPTTQAQRFDMKGDFIARYLPQLASLPAKSRHEPNSQQRQQCGYPAPMVEHKFARQRALEAFKNVLNKDSSGEVHA